MSEASPSEPRRRVVAIVGRPNVGKSALFNRLAGRRIAIVHEESGVTRDRLMREVTWGEARFQLIDTGGISNIDGARSADAIEAGIHQQVEAALSDAAVAILVVDLDAGLMPLDLEVAKRLRETGCRTVVAANKADTEARDLAVTDFAGLGLPVFPVSALHNRGIDRMMEVVIGRLPPGTNETLERPLKVAVVGRPNVGKSSFVNQLLHNDRVIVSAVPGTTRDSIDVPFTVGAGAQARHYLLIDTAGLRPMGKVHGAVERYGHMRAERSAQDADVVILMMEAVQGPTMQDKKIGALVREAGRSCLLAVNKWDLADEVTQKEYEEALRRAMPFLAYCPVVFLSAQSGFNVPRAVELVDQVAAQSRIQLPTGVLNRALQDAVERVQAPSIEGKRLKLFYATQVGWAPLRVRIFVNHPQFVRPAYTEYLIKNLRSQFGLEGVPVAIEYRERQRPEGEAERRSRVVGGGKSSRFGARTRAGKRGNRRPQQDRSGRAGRKQRR